MVWVAASLPHHSIVTHMEHIITFTVFMLIAAAVLAFSINLDVVAVLLLLVGFGLGSYNHYSPSNSN